MVVTADSNSTEVTPDTIDIQLIDETQYGTNDSQNLLETTFADSYTVTDGTNIEFNADVWESGITYILQAIVTKGNATAKAIKKIAQAETKLFTAKASPKIVTTGDDVFVTITSNTSMCLKCALGYTSSNNQLDPFWVMTNPNRICGVDQIKQVKTFVPYMKTDDASIAEMFVICFGDDESLPIEQRTDFKRIKLLVTNVELTTDSISNTTISSSDEELDTRCLSVLKLPPDTCPPLGIQKICIASITRKWSQIPTLKGMYQKLWKKLTNMLLYSLIRTMTCSTETFSVDVHDVVEVILGGICETLASNSSICSDIPSNTDNVGCNSFESKYIEKIMKVVISFAIRMNNNTAYDDLQDLLSLVKQLLKCTSTSTLFNGGYSEVSSDEGDTVALFKIDTLSEDWSGFASGGNQTTLRRRLATSNNECSLEFNAIPDNLKGVDNLLVSIEYNTDCSSYGSQLCTSDSNVQGEIKCCHFTISSISRDMSGSTSIRKISIDSSQNGQAKLGLPFDN